jgi:hypothetical protein
VAEEIPSKEAENLTAVADTDGRNAGRRGEIALMDDETGAAGQRVTDELMAVRLEAGDCHKQTALFTET